MCGVKAFVHILPWRVVAEWGMDLGAEQRPWWLDDFFWRNFPRWFFEIAVANGGRIQKGAAGKRMKRM